MVNKTSKPHKSSKIFSKQNILKKQNKVFLAFKKMEFWWEKTRAASIFDLNLRADFRDDNHLDFTRSNVTEQIEIIVHDLT